MKKAQTDWTQQEYRVITNAAKANYEEVAAALCDALRADNGIPSGEDEEMYPMVLAALVFDSDGEEERMSEWTFAEHGDEFKGSIWAMAAGERSWSGFDMVPSRTRGDELDATWPTVSEVLGFFVS